VFVEIVSTCYKRTNMIKQTYSCQSTMHLPEEIFFSKLLGLSKETP
jgi:hypothetical protein